MMKKRKIATAAMVAGTALTALVPSVKAQNSQALMDALIKKGILTEQEAKEISAQTATNMVPMDAAKWRLDKSIKSIGLFGDVRLRYEYRGADNVAGGSSGTYYRERFRYAVRIGLKGELFDNFNYGVRVETSTNPRSTWVTFGDDSNATPSAKNSDGIGIGQVYLGWKPEDWYEMTVGKMPNPIYTTAMVWDGDINPEGAAEKFKLSVKNLDLFSTFGQFIYQDTNPDTQIPSSDTFLLAWQLGANVKLEKDMSVKIAPVLYSYTGKGGGNGLNVPYTGEGLNGSNPNNSPAVNQNGINDLLVLEVPAEFNFKLASYNARLFGDFAYNLYGADRARAAATGAGLPKAYTDDVKAYQVGFGIGNLGLVYGQTSKKNTWEARAYWQHVEQYAEDVNLMDSDFFEGRGNLEGVFTAFAYSFTDSIIGTLRYGHAQRINNNLGTGGNNGDLPGLNPIKDYNLVQLDLTWRF